MRPVERVGDVVGAAAKSALWVGAKFEQRRFNFAMCKPAFSMWSVGLLGFNNLAVGAHVLQVIVYRIKLIPSNQTVPLGLL